ncbi:MAG: LamG-like jellyroll fold domain-containing protein [Tepidisphaerales bacterium]
MSSCLIFFGYSGAALGLLAISIFLAPRIASAANAKSPFADAAAVWHMANAKDSISPTAELTPRGNVKLGIELTGPDRQASLDRGGDGFVAQLDGGYLDAAQGDKGKLNLAGSAFTLCVRLRDPSGNWMAPLFSKHGGHDKLVYNLFSHDFGAGKVIGFELGTDRTRGMTQVSVALSMIGEKDWHDIICRYDGAKLQLFVDGVWMDEGFPMGPLRQGNTEPCLIGAESINGAVKSGWRGLVDHVALWSRSLSDDEIQTLSGGPAAIAAKKLQYVGALPSMQYFRPHNQFNVGDTLPFFHDGTFHFYYLLDRGHHSAKGGKGAHQWAHASSSDLIHWTEHPLAVPITREEEGSICTGSMFFHDGTWYAFYATRVIGKGEQMSVATGSDGIHFTKVEPNPLFVADAKYTNGFRDPHVFRDEQTGLFHMLVATMLKEGNRGCLAQYTSKDLKTWTEAAPFLIEGREVPECPDYFQWNGRYYLIFSFGQVAHYRIAKQPLGPWEKPTIDVIDGGAARVLKTAAFTGNRRIGTASIWPFGYAGWAVFRELVQNDDGTLGSKFVPEMIPATGEPAALELKALTQGSTGDVRQVRLRSAEDTALAMLGGLPRNARVQLRIDAKAASFGLRLRASAEKVETHEIRFTPAQRKAGITGGKSLASVDGLDRPLQLDIILKDNILDLCINQQRTLVDWVPDLRGDRLILFVDKGEASFDQITVRPLR